MALLRSHRLGLIPLLVGSLWFAACGGGTVDIDEDDPNDPNDPRIDNGFESDDPVLNNEGGARGGGESADASAGSSGSNSGGPPQDNSGDAARAIEEADIVKVDGARLYALSRFGGLSVIDTSDPDHLRLVGRKRLGGQPFEMYLRGTQAYVMLNDFGRYVEVDGNPWGSWVNTSEMLAIDLSNLNDIREYAHYDIPGTIADSRLVGDAMYVVTNEDGYCWGCERNQAGAVVTSFNIGSGGIARVDQLAFRSPQNGYTWQRSVSATNERLYIAGPEYNWQPGQETANSIIQVVDIRDPYGHMTKGADVPVHGQVMSRWQMDEWAGVLRVVSQNSNVWWGGGVHNPSVQTFTVHSSSSITPLGQTELILPEPESLRSVRFDGARGYAITAQQSDPLYTIDLSNPAQPRQAAELQMPGWITHLEPRGDRLIGFGFADTNWNSKLAVSLFDVEDLAAPTMLERVEFSNGGGGYAEDQDRIHKSVQVLDDKGLVLVPYASYGRWTGESCSEPQSGIQIIDYSHDHLTKRGVAPQYGQSRRALLTGERLLAMSDRTVTAFDITDRNAPKQTSEIDLSNPAYQLTRIGNHIASITNDWWTSEVVLSLTPHDNPDDATVSSKLSLASLADPSSDLCGGGSSWTNWYQARLFPFGQNLVVSVPVMNWRDNGYDNKMVFGVVDLSDPSAPRLINKTVVQLAGYENNYYGYYGCGGFFDGWGYYGFYGGALLSDGESMVQVGNKLAYLENSYEPVYVYDNQGNISDYTPKMHRRLHVLDFTNASAPAVSTPIALGESRGSAPLLVNGTEVLTSRWRRSPSNPQKVKFYLDRVDLAGDAPVVLPSVNTPGAVVNVDSQTRRLVSVDYTRSSFPASDYQTCYNDNDGVSWFDWNKNRCVRVSRNFKLSDFDGASVTLRNTYQPPTQRLGGIKVTDDRVYLTRLPHYEYRNDNYARIEAGAVIALGGIRAGELAQVSQFETDSYWPLAAKGNTIALYTYRGFAVYDSASPNGTLLAEQTLNGWGYASDVLLEDNRAVCSLGEWGMQTVPLSR